MPSLSISSALKSAAEHTNANTCTRHSCFRSHHVRANKRSQPSMETTMDVKVQRSHVIPAPPSQPSEEVPFTVFDLVAPPYHVTVLFAFTAPNPTNAALLDALAATLPRFPLLTARLVNKPPSGRRPFFVTGSGGAGALVVEAEVPAPLADHLPLAPSPRLDRLHAAPLDVNVEEARAPHLLQIQINRFACGGLVVASSAHHQAADGCSMSTFFRDWVDAVRSGAPPSQPVRPVPYGPGALTPRRPPRCEFEHRGAQFMPVSKKDDGGDARSNRQIMPEPVRLAPSEIANMTLHYTREFVAGLKAAGGHSKYTTFETVSAHLWRKITAARLRGADASDSTRTSLNVSVNGRARLVGPDAGVPRDFFGNLVLTARTDTASAGAPTTTTAGDLVRGSLADAAAKVRAGVRAVDRRYFQSFIDFGELYGDDEELEPSVGDEDYHVLLPDVEADSWLHLELHKLDFGCGGRLVGVLPGRVPLDGVIVLMPGLQKEGGVDVFVALYEKHAKELRNIAYTMD